MIKKSALLFVMMASAACSAQTATPSPTLSPTFPTANPTMNPFVSTGTLKPTTNPTMAPTKNPTLFPTRTASPTLNPTAFPSRNPTKNPTRLPTSTANLTSTTSPSPAPTRTVSPTSNPTAKPTTMSPTTIIGGRTLDLYLIIDFSASIAKANAFCDAQLKKQGKVAGGTCTELYVDFLSQLVKDLGAAIGYHQKNGDKSGLRVAILGFSCENSQKTPLVIPLLETPTGDKVAIENAFKKAKATIPAGGSCPALALNKYVQRVEDLYIEAENRPFRVAITGSDAKLYDFKATGELSQKIASEALRERCVETFAMPIKIGGLDMSADEKLQQKKFLMQLAGSWNNVIPLSTGNPSIDLLNAIEAYTKKAANNPKCNDPTLYKRAPQRYCGYSKTQCQNRWGCQWSNTDFCQVVHNCMYPKPQTECAKDSRCLLKPANKCVSLLNCVAIADKATCNAKPGCTFGDGFCHLE